MRLQIIMVAWIHNRSKFVTIINDDCLIKHFLRLIQTYIFLRIQNVGEADISLTRFSSVASPAASCSTAGASPLGSACRAASREATAGAAEAGPASLRLCHERAFTPSSRSPTSSSSSAYMASRACAAGPRV